MIALFIYLFFCVALSIEITLDFQVNFWIQRRPSVINSTFLHCIVRSKMAMNFANIELVNCVTVIDYMAE